MYIQFECYTVLRARGSGLKRLHDLERDSNRWLVRFPERSCNQRPGTQMVSLQMPQRSQALRTLRSQALFPECVLVPLHNKDFGAWMMHRAYVWLQLPQYVAELSPCHPRAAVQSAKCRPGLPFQLLFQAGNGTMPALSPCYQK